MSDQKIRVKDAVVGGLYFIPEWRQGFVARAPVIRLDAGTFQKLNFTCVRFLSRHKVVELVAGDNLYLDDELGLADSQALHVTRRI